MFLQIRCGLKFLEAPARNGEHAALHVNRVSCSDPSSTAAVGNRCELRLDSGKGVETLVSQFRYKLSYRIQQVTAERGVSAALTDF
jgi:hypothetical protein